MAADTGAGSVGIGLGGILVIVGIVLAIVWSVWIGIIIAVGPWRRETVVREDMYERRV